jgi:hypothetical protein
LAFFSALCVVGVEERKNFVHKKMRIIVWKERKNLFSWRLNDELNDFSFVNLEV